MSWFSWFKRKENKNKSTYLLDERSHTCHFFQDCEIKSDNVRAVKGDDWPIKYFKYSVCPVCSERNTKDLNDGIKWMFTGMFMYVALKEAGLEKDEKALNTAREALQEMWDEEHGNDKRLQNLKT